jgi:3-phosphoshikimate 1-carboxyvinyltransferase
MKLHCDINLPASKSESNRVLMIAAYGDFAPDCQNLLDSNDTLVLANALSEIQQNHAVIDIADSGTAARFLTTCLSCRSGSWLLTGTERMKQRPIKPLVEALSGLDASIQYAEKEGFMPLKIEGKPIQGGKVQIDMSQSSQFASSLLLAAPMWPQGLEMELLGDLRSLPYLSMTLAMMRHFGADVERNGRTIIVKPKSYQPVSFKVSSDWSAASYWYEIAALSEACEIRLRDLLMTSLQGDVIIAEWMKSLGINTIEDNGSLVLKKIPYEKQPLHFDFSAHPDLFPTIAATCAGLRLEACLTGVANLSIKESDRVEAMKVELAKIGVEMFYVSENEVVLRPSTDLPLFAKSNPLRFSAHADHRIVMALAPLSLKIGSVAFDTPEVVAKSYPDFWIKIAKIVPNILV